MSLLKQLQDEVAKTLEITNDKYDELLLNYVKRHILVTKKDNLLSVAKTGYHKYYVFKVDFTNKTKVTSMHLNNYEYTAADSIKIMLDSANTFMIVNNDTIKSYNIRKKCIHYNYLYKLFKSAVKDIDDVKPVCNDNTKEIYYEW